MWEYPGLLILFYYWCTFFYVALRDDPPHGNTVNRAPTDVKPKNQSPEILLAHLMEGIGIALDLKVERMFVTDLGGSIYSAKLDGSDKKTLLYAQGNIVLLFYLTINKSI